jgi:hypothetical protein
MKTSVKTKTTICAVLLSLSVLAQHKARPNQPQQQNHNNNQNDKHTWASNNNHHGGNWGGVTVQIGGYPNNYGNYYGNNYGYGYNNYNYNSIKKTARNSIRQSASVIGQALQFSDWNDMYSPWLAKAIRHQQYAKQLYFWGDYAGALNHSERAGFLAWNSLSYFNNAYGNDDGFAGNNYQNPNSDPNNPYYRQNNSGAQPNNTSSENDDFGYRKSSTENTSENGTSVQKEVQPNTSQSMEKSELDNSLPQSKANDKELLKLHAKDLDIE